MISYGEGSTFGMYVAVRLEPPGTELWKYPRIATALGKKVPPGTYHTSLVTPVAYAGPAFNLDHDAVEGVVEEVKDDLERVVNGSGILGATLTHNQQVAEREKFRRTNVLTFTQPDEARLREIAYDCVGILTGHGLLPPRPVDDNIMHMTLGRRGTPDWPLRRGKVLPTFSEPQLTVTGVTIEPHVRNRRTLPQQYFEDR